MNGEKINWGAETESFNQYRKKFVDPVRDLPFFTIGGRGDATNGQITPVIQGMNLPKTWLLATHRDYGDDLSFPGPISRPDQVHILTETTEGVERWTVAETKLFISDANFLACEVEGRVWEILEPEPEEMKTGHEFSLDRIREAVNNRNRTWEEAISKGAIPNQWLTGKEGEVSASMERRPVALADVFPIHTSQEIDALICGAADGRRGGSWRNETARDVRLWGRKSFAHRLELARTHGDETAPVSWEGLEALTSDQNADFALALFYVAGALCPPPDSAQPRPGVAWIDLSDVCDKIGWFKEKPNARKREELRYRLWRFLIFGEEARVIGARGGTYHDKQSKRKIETYIESPVWKILDKEMPKQGTLFDELKPAPLRVEVAVSSTFQRIFSDPQFAQFMPLGELLGAIAPNKVAGDWARLMGVTLARKWRCKPRETRAEELQISRRELLTHYAPKTGTVEELLASDKPKRAVIYYREHTC